MRLVRFRHNGGIRHGQLTDGRILPFAEHVGPRPFLVQGPLALKLRSTGDGSNSIDLDEVELLPPIADPSKILCVGLNYHEHVQETGRTPAGYPTIFTRFADTQLGHGQAIVAPPESDKVDYEAELAVIIGKPGRRISESAAMDHVGGYACYNDVSIRDWQKHGAQWTPGKNFPATGPFGPWIITADELGDPTNLTIEARLNGQTVQKASTSQLIFSIAHLIAYISKFTPLNTGDVICTGTPGGVGFARNPPLFMKPGDVVEIEIERIGVLRNPVVAEVVSTHD